MADINFFGQALHLKKQNANPAEIYRLLYLDKKQRLLEYQENKVVSKVKILTCDDESTCPECKKLNNKIFTLNQALQEMPIPYKNCCNLNDGDNSGFICRCLYVPLVDD